MKLKVAAVLLAVTLAVPASAQGIYGGTTRGYGGGYGGSYGGSTPNYGYGTGSDPNTHSVPATPHAMAAMCSRQQHPANHPEQR